MVATPATKSTAQARGQEVPGPPGSDTDSPWGSTEQEDATEPSDHALLGTVGAVKPRARGAMILKVNGNSAPTVCVCVHTRVPAASWELQGGDLMSQQQRDKAGGQEAHFRLE